jgi:hypothetical protein
LALITSKDHKRLTIPHEPDQWVEVRPLTFGDMDLFGMDGETVAVSRDLAAEVITSWSYGEWPATKDERLDLIKSLDLDTAMWLITSLGETLTEISGIRGDSEKKDSPSNSPPTTSTEADSPPTSPTSSSSEG